MGIIHPVSSIDSAPRSLRLGDGRRVVRGVAGVQLGRWRWSEEGRAKEMKTRRKVGARAVPTTVFIELRIDRQVQGP